MIFSSGCSSPFLGLSGELDETIDLLLSPLYTRGVLFVLFTYVLHLAPLLSQDVEEDDDVYLLLLLWLHNCVLW